ncbi:hypothetical protein D9M68_1006280 [compost metagenome]
MAARTHLAHAFQLAVFVDEERNGYCAGLFEAQRVFGPFRFVAFVKLHHGHLVLLGPRRVLLPAFACGGQRRQRGQRGGIA